MGSHVADKLSAKGCQVTICDLHESMYLQSGQEMIVVDLLDEKKVRAAIRGMDVLYNFAGISDIGEAAVRPLDTVKNNILGNALLLDAAKDEGVKRFIFASSIYVYSSAGSFYRCSKMACENYIEAYYERYGLEFTILRYGSLYGPRAQEWNGLKQFIVQAVRDNKIVYPGTGEERREYIHVQDAAKLSVKALGPEFANQCLTLTGTQVFSIKEVMSMVREIIGHEIKIEFSAKEGNHEPFHYSLTPYRYTPHRGEKIVPPIFIDLGEGILEMVDEINRVDLSGSNGYFST